MRQRPTPPAELERGVGDLRVSADAVSRYRERVEPVSADEARAKLSSPFIRKAAEFGAEYVKLGTGQHVVIENGRIVTVLPADTWLGTMGKR